VYCRRQSCKHHGLIATVTASLCNAAVARAAADVAGLAAALTKYCHCCCCCCSCCCCSCCCCCRGEYQAEVAMMTRTILFTSDATSTSTTLGGCLFVSSSQYINCLPPYVYTKAGVCNHLTRLMSAICCLSDKTQYVPSPSSPCCTRHSAVALCNTPSCPAPLQ
jgi:hypothetical protein